MILKYYIIFNYSSIVLVFMLLMLMVLKLVPTELFMPLLYIGIAILVLRIILRIYLSSYNKKLQKGG
ncbi:MAG: hypothetical protein DRQ01_01885 [Ignavibacteriae bacterium]|nr:MAG: hypothetical protein DRQ01_01885 [Ignavibacteriota bacterium]